MDTCKASETNLVQNDNEIDTSNMKQQTLVFIMQDDKVLLGMKKRGFGKGKWNGYGGKVEGMETIKDCAVREVHEENNLIVEKEDLRHLGFIQFMQADKFERKVQIYTCDNYTGVVRETEEMKPEWFHFDKIPYKEMWEDAYFWMHFVFKRIPFEATFTLDENADIRNIHIDLKR